MPQARLTISLPEGVWIHDLSNEHPEAEFRVLAAIPAGDTGVGLVEITAPDLPAVVEGMGGHAGITSLDVLQHHGDRALVQFETTEPLLLFSVREAGMPLEPPVTIRDGDASVELTASQDRLSTLGEQLRAFGMSFEVESIRQTIDPGGGFLTEKQRRLVTAAVEAGYYDTPRECTLTELADRLDLAKSTVSETLHRAEGKIVKRFVEESPEYVFDAPAEARPPR